MAALSMPCADNAVGSASTQSPGFVFALRRRAATALRKDVPEIRQAVYKAYVAGLVDDDQAAELDELLNVRLAVPAVAPAVRCVGSRPRTPASRERRQLQSAQNWMPARLAAAFTLAERSVMAVVLREVKAYGACELPIDQIAAYAGVCRRTVKYALRQAVGLLNVEVRRRTATRNDTNRITIVSAELRAFLGLDGRDRGGRRRTPPGGKFVPTTSLLLKEKRTSTPSRVLGGVLPEVAQPSMSRVEAFEGRRGDPWRSGQPLGCP